VRLRQHFHSKGHFIGYTFGYAAKYKMTFYTNGETVSHVGEFTLYFK